MNVTVSEIQAFREKNHCSLFEAKNHFKRKALREKLQSIAYRTSDPYVRSIAEVTLEILDETLPAKYD